MQKLFAWIQNLISSERGQDAVEYALITAIMGGVVIAVTFGLLTAEFNTWVTNVGGLLSEPFV
jgi:Flp pilus assembly pilin Flp